MKSYSIGDFAREMGVSADFIKYYEKSSLLSPQVNASNRYRSLSFEQCRRVIEIRKYRNLDFKVGEIEDLLNDGSDAEIMDALEGKRRENDARAAWHRLLSDYFAFIRETAARRGRRDSWYVRPHPAMYFLPHTDKTSFIGTRAVRERFCQWGRYLPVVHSACLISPGSMDGDASTDSDASTDGDASGAGYNYGLCVLADHAKQLGLSVAPPAQEIPARRCFEYVWDAAFVADPSERDPAFETVAQLARDNHFEIAGKLLSLFVFPYKKGPEYRTIQVFYVPIA